MPVRNRMRMLMALFVALVVPIPLKAEDGKQSRDPSRALVETEIGGVGDDLKLPVSFRGKTYRFIVDTGASCTIFDKSFRPFLGERKNAGIADTAHGSTKFELFEAPDAVIGTLSLKCVETVACADLERCREVSGKDDFGILGMDFLGKYVVELNSDGGTLALLKSASSSAGFPVLMYYDRNAPYILAEIPHLGSRSFFLDTGYCGSGLLAFDDCRQLTSRGTFKSLRAMQFMDLSGEVQSRCGTLTEIAVGNFRHKDLDFDEGRPGAPTSCGILGLTFLRRYNVTLDFPNRLMYLRKSKHFDDPELRDLSGLHLLANDGRIVIRAVGQNSLAARADMREHDLIIRIDGKEVKPVDLQAFRRALCSNGKTVRLAVQRDGRMINVILKLEPSPETVADSGVNRNAPRSPGTR
jgi:hypothetical protein